MTTLPAALRVLSWTAVICILGVALVARDTERSDWCPTDVPPSSCSTIAPAFPTGGTP